MFVSFIVNHHRSRATIDRPPFDNAVSIILEIYENVKYNTFV